MSKPLLTWDYSHLAAPSLQGPPSWLWALRQGPLWGGPQSPHLNRREHLRLSHRLSRGQLGLRVGPAVPQGRPSWGNRLKGSSGPSNSCPCLLGPMSLPIWSPVPSPGAVLPQAYTGECTRL